MRCEQELCSNWDGDGCPCRQLGLEPAVVCSGCGDLETHCYCEVLDGGDGS